MAIMKNIPIRELLQDAGLRVTQARKDVLAQFLAAGEQAVSSHDIEQQLSGIDRITLYRILKAFEEIGLIHSITDGSGKTKYALCTEDCSDGVHHHNHLHFSCRLCETTTCLQQTIPSNLKLPKGYIVEDMQFVLKGICAACSYKF